MLSDAEIAAHAKLLEMKEGFFGSCTSILSAGFALVDGVTLATCISSLWNIALLANG